MAIIQWLHLSDLHFGYDNFTVKEFRKRLPDVLKNYTEKNNVTFDYIFVTGDLRYGKSENNADVDYEAAVKFLKDLCGSITLNPPDPKILVIPGNHDVDILENSERIEAVKKIRGVYMPRIGKIDSDTLKKLKPTKAFQKAFQRITNTDFINNHTLYKEEKINILCLDTSLVCTKSGADYKTLFIGMEDVQNLLQGVKEDQPLIILAHHSTDWFEGREEDLLLEFLIEHKACAYLCGHSHTKAIMEIRTFSHPDESLSLIIAPTSMDQDEQGKQTTTMGFLTGQIDTETRAGTITLYQWDINDSKIYQKETVPLTINVKERITQPIPFVFVSDIDISEIDGIPRYVMPLDKKGSGYSLLWSDETQRETLFTALGKHNHIILLGEGSAGKTFALQQLFANAALNGFTPVFLNLKYYPENKSLDKLLSPDSRIPNDYLFILDGFDEIDEQHIRSFVNKINCPNSHLQNVRIVVSSRWNFYEYQDIDNQTLMDFLPYTLRPITNEDRSAYLEDSDINKKDFYNEIIQKNLRSLIQNPFYFVALVEYWKNTATLPDQAQAMCEIIQKRIDIDFMKYRNKKALKKEQYTIWEALKQLASLMQWTRLSELKEMDYQSCLCGNTRDLLSHISIWNQNMRNAWEFEHNNFREYFAALYLNDKTLDDITSIAFHDNHKVRSTWINVLSYLAIIRESNDLRDWIYTHNPSLVLAYEPSRFTHEQRINIFISIIEQHEKDETWIDTYAEYSKMADFGGCRETLSYLLNKLQGTISQKHKHNILRVLALFTDLYEMKDEISQHLLGIACDAIEETPVRTDAIHTMTSLKLFEDSAVEKLVQHNGQSSDIHLSERLYEYLLESGKAAAYTHVFLWGAENIDKHSTISMLFLEGLEEGQKAANTVEALEAVFTHYQQHPQQATDREACRAYSVCCITAAKLYTPETNPFIDCFAASLPPFFHVSANEATQAIKGFISNTQTESLFLLKVLALGSPMNYILVEELINDRTAELLLELYQQGKVPDPALIPLLADRMNVSAVWYTSFLDAIEKVTGQRPVPPQRVDYQKIRQQGEQRFLNAMFDQSRFSAIVQELIDILGADMFVSDLLSNRSDRIDYHRVDLMHCERALFHGLKNKEKVTLGESLTKIDWEWFSHHNLFQMLENQKQITLSGEQFRQVREWCLSKLGLIDLETIASNKTPQYLQSRAILVISLINLLDISCSREKTLDMLLIPAFWFSRQYLDRFPDYITGKLEVQALTQQILKNISTKNLQGLVAECHVKFCLEYNLVEAKDLAIKMLTQDKKGFMSIPMQYLYELFGAEETSKYILPFCKNEKLLERLASTIPISEYPNQLESRIIEEYNAGHHGQWQGILIQRNNPQAIQDYYQNALCAHRIPDYQPDRSIPNVTATISHINDVSQLGTLNSLLLLSCEEDFIDKNGYFGLRYHACQAIENIAQQNYITVIQLLEQSKNEAHAESKSRDTITDLVQRINEQHTILEDKPLPFSDAKKSIFGI